MTPRGLVRCEVNSDGINHGARTSKEANDLAGGYRNRESISAIGAEGSVAFLLVLSVRFLTRVILATVSTDPSMPTRY
ncbi:hypothetical protein GW17_00034341 [Ensete ventricosum]|nr:hypothetical protein GW17_00034341 [Ensete ventricosum]